MFARLLATVGWGLSPSKSMADEPYGYICPQCKVWNIATFSMIDNWDLPQIQLCPVCKRSNSLYRGRVLNTPKDKVVKV